LQRFIPANAACCGKWIMDWRSENTGSGTAAAPAAKRPSFLRRIFSFLRDSGELFFAKNAQSRGAAMAFYAVTSIAPVLLIIIAIAGAVFGEDAARGAIFAQFQSVLGADGAELLQNTIAGVSNGYTGIIASLVGIGILILTASGVFLELEDALNTIWDAKPEGSMLSGMVRARLASLGLVMALGLLLLVTLVADVGLRRLSDVVNAYLPFGAEILLTVNFLLSFALIAVLFAAIYKVLPARPLSWRYVIFGAVVTAGLFQIGKFLLGLYLSRSAASGLGAAGALLALLFWIYYSAQIILFGAALTKVYRDRSLAKQESPPSLVP